MRAPACWLSSCRLQGLTRCPTHAGVQFKEAPPEALLNQWAPLGEEDADARLAQYGKDHMLVHDEASEERRGAALG